MMLTERPYLSNSLMTQNLVYGLKIPSKVVQTYCII